MALAIYSAVSGWQASVFPLARSMAIKLALVLPCRAAASSGHCERSQASAVRIVSANVGSASGSGSGSAAAGGATGVGILRDLSMRGIDALLIEKLDMVNGASSRYHGLLHSGARYAVKDQEAARE